MLASPMSSLGRTPEQAMRAASANPRWVAEAKLDGIRALVTRTTDDVRITNRRGDVITHRYPDVVALVLEQTDVPCVLDGEIVVAREGRIDFAGAHKRDAQESAYKAAQLAKTLPAVFVAFDVLSVGDQDARSQSNAERRAILESLPALRVPLVPRSEDVWGLWRAVVAQDGEGIVLKDCTSRYELRRSRSWVKVKRTHRVTVLVAEADAGSGHRGATFGALRMQLWDPATRRLVDVGRVGSGFTDAQTREVAAALADPAQLPLTVEVEYLEVAAMGHLRQPVFRGLRTDVDRTDCTLEQLRPTRPS